MRIAAPNSSSGPRLRVGRFELSSEIASGGTATIHLGRLLGDSGFSRVVAIKRLHPQLAKTPEFTRQFLDEARVVARIHHPNVLPTLDLIEGEGELLIVMEFVAGETFGKLLREAKRRRQRVPLGVALRIMCGTLSGLHAAHDARSEQGKPLGLVHRDVSPDNILVGTDGYARLLDFGIARALGRYHNTRDGEVKGKLGYMTPEQLLGEPLDRRSDVFAASVVLWQALTGRQLFRGRNMGAYVRKVLNKAIDPPSYVVPDLPKKFDPIVLKGLERDPAKRWPTALAMAEALEAVGDLATLRETGVWVRTMALERIQMLEKQMAAAESAPVTRRSKSPPMAPRRSPPRRVKASDAAAPPTDEEPDSPSVALAAAKQLDDDAAEVESVAPVSATHQRPRRLRVATALVGPRGTAAVWRHKLTVGIGAVLVLTVVAAVAFWSGARSVETPGAASSRPTAATQPSSASASLPAATTTATDPAPISGTASHEPTDAGGERVNAAAPPVSSKAPTPKPPPPEPKVSAARAPATPPSPRTTSRPPATTTAHPPSSSLYGRE